VDLSNKQRRILKNASKLVQPGGRLIYSTCSLQVEENEDVCLSFLTEVEGFTQIRPQVPERFITGRNFARTFPHRDAMDGFFIAAFERSPK
jgi:16S rRNA (cytosine967-C5)-methyltransferase